MKKLFNKRLSQFVIFTQILAFGTLTAQPVLAISPGSSSCPLAAKCCPTRCGPNATEDLEMATCCEALAGVAAVGGTISTLVSALAGIPILGLNSIVWGATSGGYCAVCLAAEACARGYQRDQRVLA